MFRLISQTLFFSLFSVVNLYYLYKYINNVSVTPNGQCYLSTVL